MEKKNFNRRSLKKAAENCGTVHRCQNQSIKKKADSISAVRQSLITHHQQNNYYLFCLTFGHGLRR